jgi:hypothetical protein
MPSAASFAQSVDRTTPRQASAKPPVGTGTPELSHGASPAATKAHQETAASKAHHETAAKSQQKYSDNYQAIFRDHVKGKKPSAELLATAHRLATQAANKATKNGVLTSDEKQAFASDEQEKAVFDTFAKSTGCPVEAAKLTQKHYKEQGSDDVPSVKQILINQNKYLKEHGSDQQTIEHRFKKVSTELVALNKKLLLTNLSKEEKQKTKAEISELKQEATALRHIMIPESVHKMQQYVDTLNLGNDVIGEFLVTLLGGKHDCNPHSGGGKPVKDVDDNKKPAPPEHHANIDQPPNAAGGHQAAAASSTGQQHHHAKDAAYKDDLGVGESQNSEGA